MRHTTTQALVQRFAGSETDVVGFAQALRLLGATSQRHHTLGVLLDDSGHVLAVADSDGRIQTWTRVEIGDVDEIELDFEDDGWFRTEHTFWYVHRAQPFVLLRRGRLAISRAEELPSDAQRLPNDDITPFMQLAADCIEAYAGGE